MQNIDTIKELGFQQNAHGEWFFRGEHQYFVAKEGYDGKFVELFRVSLEIDRRPHSTHRGRHYKELIKDCCAKGSLAAAIKKYDTFGGLADLRKGKLRK